MQLRIFRKVFDQVLKFSGIVSIPRCHSKLVYGASICIYADMEFDAVLPFVSSFDPYVIPGTAVAGTKTCAVKSYPSFLFSWENMLLWFNAFLM
jgi:hypothetical protein